MLSPPFLGRLSWLLASKRGRCLRTRAWLREVVSCRAAIPHREAPEEYYAFHEDPSRPQPRIEREVGGGMTTTIGRVEKEELFDHGIKYMLFSHNKKMGSAKGAVLLAEMLYKKGKI